MAQRNKQRKQIYSKTFTELKDLESKFQKDPSNSKLKDLIINFQHQLNIVLTKEIAHKMKLARQHANRIGK